MVMAWTKNSLLLKISIYFVVHKVFSFPFQVRSKRRDVQEFTLALVSNSPLIFFIQAKITTYSMLEFFVYCVFTDDAFARKIRNQYKTNIKLRWVQNHVRLEN